MKRFNHSIDVVLPVERFSSNGPLCINFLCQPRRQVPIELKIVIVGGILQRPVLDATSRLGVFAVTLTWVMLDEPIENDASEEAGPSICVALQEQLGLRLESRKVPTDAL